jgi:hypothetical protein
MARFVTKTTVVLSVAVVFAILATIGSMQELLNGNNWNLFVMATASSFIVLLYLNTKDKSNAIILVRLIACMLIALTMVAAAKSGAVGFSVVMGLLVFFVLVAIVLPLPKKLWR